MDGNLQALFDSLKTINEKGDDAERENVKEFEEHLVQYHQCQKQIEQLEEEKKSIGQKCAEYMRNNQHSSYDYDALGVKASAWEKTVREINLPKVEALMAKHGVQPREIQEVPSDAFQTLWREHLSVEARQQILNILEREGVAVDKLLVFSEALMATAFQMSVKGVDEQLYTRTPTGSWHFALRKQPKNK